MAKRPVLFGLALVLPLGETNDFSLAWICALSKLSASRRTATALLRLDRLDRPDRLGRSFAVPVIGESSINTT